MKKNIRKISIKDYIKAVKKADREIQLDTSPGWVSVNKIHTSKKIYNRKKITKITAQTNEGSISSCITTKF